MGDGGGTGAAGCTAAICTGGSTADGGSIWTTIVFPEVQHVSSGLEWWNSLASRSRSPKPWDPPSPQFSQTAERPVPHWATPSTHESLWERQNRDRSRLKNRARNPGCSLQQLPSSMGAVAGVPPYQYPPVVRGAVWLLTSELEITRGAGLD